ncbi:HD1 tpye of homeodomain transcription factor A mating type protein [Agaricus bisporus var. burnettii JB137-S8]|uniref:HD1 tpye of homeodomain transcription factor A mating type protein n=1 Tax=Agaricus bisporus var. burnettii (strain JB137-S8 / ATCC MYA-4627 / FGSC 10392) TaxID=597362 RepID=K5WC23_AGABU|nr:HD1 tpye of homeodomain transcription factor A mating type protein [Agaricus bisporus var. burnettii JB137-S8]EKM84449.1 HD1 tpye of homeodomain transcription factor A mating type protein [Agaricus bisporus var. burnettii JB137-S8]
MSTRSSRKTVKQSLCRRFSDAESAFLDALDVGGGAMTAFEEEWTHLRDDFEAACIQGDVDPETASYARLVTYRIAEISSSFLKLEATCKQLTDSLMADLASIPELRQSQVLDTPQETISSRRDVSLAAEWLSKNFFNPYPSSTVRDRISHQSNWNRKDVDAWFTEARRRIGWNDIRKQYFQNKRAGAVERATEFFNGSPTCFDAVLSQAFIDMESRVQDLYVEPYKPSKLAVVLGKGHSDEAAFNMQKGFSTPFKSPRTLSPSRRSLTSSSRSASPIDSSVSICQTNRKRPRSDKTDQYHSQHPRKKLREEEPTTIMLQAQPTCSSVSQSSLEEVSVDAITKGSSAVARPARSPRLSPFLDPQRKQLHPEALDLPNNAFGGSRTIRSQTTSALGHTQSNACTPMAPDLGSINPTSLSNFRPSASSTIMPDLQVDFVHDISHAEISELSYTFPGPLTHDQPTLMQPVDQPWSNSATSAHLPTYDLSMSTLLETASQAMPPNGNTDVVPSSDLFNNCSFYDDQLFELLRPPFGRGAPAVPPMQNFQGLNTEVDISLAAPYLDFESCTSQIPQPQIDDILADFIHNFSAPPVDDAEKLKRVAHVEMLKREKEHLQERLQSLYVSLPLVINKRLT